MHIVNKTKKTIIAEDALETKSLKDKTLGLLAYNKPRALVLRTRFGIHTFGMKYPIEIVVVSQLGKVVKICKNVVPNRFVVWNIRHKLVLELPKGSIENSRTRIGDTIEII